MRKLELEVEKLEAEVACKEADLRFSAACTRMKLAEAELLEAKAHLEWEFMAEGRDEAEMRILNSNARRGEAMAEQDERNNRLYVEGDLLREERIAKSQKAPVCPRCALETFVWPDDLPEHNRRFHEDAVQYGEVDLEATPELRTDVPGVVGRAPYQPIA